MRKIKQLWYKLNGRLDPYGTDVQKIFDKVIEQGHYTSRFDYMCLALEVSAFTCTINKQQEKLAKEEIIEYIGSYAALESALWENKLDSSFQHRLAIYKDWANRPKLEVK